VYRCLQTQNYRGFLLPISCLLSPCLPVSLSPVSCLLSPISVSLPLLSLSLSPVSYSALSPVSLSPVSLSPNALSPYLLCLPISITCLLSPVSCLLSPISLSLSPVSLSPVSISYLLSPMPAPVSLSPCLLSISLMVKMQLDGNLIASVASPRVKNDMSDILNSSSVLEVLQPVQDRTPQELGGTEHDSQR